MEQDSIAKSVKLLKSFRKWRTVVNGGKCASAITKPLLYR